MIRSDLPGVANHIWQSTFFACVMWALSWALRNNRAAVRYRLWLAASAKFLIPFSVFVDLGSRLGWRTVAATHELQWPLVIGNPSRPFAAPLPVPNHATHASVDLIPPLLLAIWFCGFAASMLFWLRCWTRTRAIRQSATPLPLRLPIPVMSCTSRIEPGVFGIWRPVLLLPEGIAEGIAPAQFDAIVAHEMCHVCRNDNLTGAVHLIVETIFWFHPLVWWIRARLLEERERACDEAVLEAGAEPQTYAEGILNVCRSYIASELACVSAISGSNLRERIERIAGARIGRRLDWSRRLLVAGVGAAAAGVPLAIGLLHAHPVRAQVQQQPAMSFEVASVKPNKSGDERSTSLIQPGGRFTATNNTLRYLILNAYGIFASPYLLQGGPGWIDAERFDIDAKAAANAVPAGTPDRVLWDKTRVMLQALLADRFQLLIHRETKEMPVYRLVVAKSGPKLQRTSKDCDPGGITCHGYHGNPRRFIADGVDMKDLALMLSIYSDRPVVDGTGIQGLFDVKLQWNPFAPRTPPADDTPRSAAVEAREGLQPDLASLPTLPEALQQQLGLTLESHKGPVEIYVIDHVERPSRN